MNAFSKTLLLPVWLMDVARLFVNSANDRRDPREFSWRGFDRILAPSANECQSELVMVHQPNLFTNPKRASVTGET